MDKYILCERCKIKLGVIRDAKLRKGIIFLCKDCNVILLNKKDSTMDEFMRIFK